MYVKLNLKLTSTANWPTFPIETDGRIKVRPGSILRSSEVNRKSIILKFSIDIWRFSRKLTLFFKIYEFSKIVMYHGAFKKMFCLKKCYKWWFRDSSQNMLQKSPKLINLVTDKYIFQFSRKHIEMVLNIEIHHYGYPKTFWMVEDVPNVLI